VEGQGTLTERRKNAYDPVAYPMVLKPTCRNTLIQDMCSWIPPTPPTSRPGTAPPGGRPRSAGASRSSLSASRSAAALAARPGWDESFAFASRDASGRSGTFSAAALGGGGYDPRVPPVDRLGPPLPPSAEHETFKAAILGEVARRKIYKQKDIKALFATYIVAHPGHRHVLREVIAELKALLQLV